MCPIKTTLVISMLLTGTAAAQTAEEVIRRMDDKARGASSKAEITMTIVRPDWQRSISMKTWSKGTEYSLILITSPARDKGTAFLKRENEIWNWVPNIGRTVKLPPSMMMQSWMGSDFTNDDLVQESSIVKDYTHEFGPDSTIDQHEAYKIILTPKPDAPVVWGAVHTWVTKDEYLQLRAEFYDEDGYMVNLMTGSELKVFDGRLLPSRLEMTPVDDPGNKTILDYESLEFDVDIRNNFFTVSNLKRIQ